MTPIARAALALLLGLALAACHGPAPWTKPGVSPETTRADFLDCEREADDVVARDENIDNDILVTRGHDWQRANTLGAKKDTFALQNRGRAQDIIDRCMASKGYSPGG